MTEQDKGLLTPEEIYRKALEDDASDLWKVTNQIKMEIKSRHWILEGRGSYEWDDNRYKDETRLAFEAVLKLIENIQHPAQARFFSTFREAQHAKDNQRIEELFKEIENIKKGLEEINVSDKKYYLEFWESRWRNFWQSLKDKYGGVK